MFLETLSISVVSTICCLAGPLALWYTHRRHPEWFAGRLPMVKWLVAGCIGIMLITLAANLYWMRSRPVPPPVVAPATQIDAADRQQMEKFFAPPPPPRPMEDGAGLKF